MSEKLVFSSSAIMVIYVYFPSTRRLKLGSMNFPEIINQSEKNLVLKGTDLSRWGVTWAGRAEAVRGSSRGQNSSMGILGLAKVSPRGGRGTKVSLPSHA